MMATNSPRATVKSRPLRMSTVRGPLRMDLRSPVTTIMDPEEVAEGSFWGKRCCSFNRRAMQREMRRGPLIIDTLEGCGLFLRLRL